MKVAVCAKREGMDAELDDRFGRAEFFTVIETNTMKSESIENIAKNEAGGAGSLAIRNLASHGVEAIIAPELGPQAVEAVNAFKIKVYDKGSYRSISEVVKAYLAGSLKEIDTTPAAKKKGLHRV